MKVEMMRDLVSVDEVMASVPKERRERIEARGKELIAQVEQCKAEPDKSSEMHSIKQPGFDRAV